LELLVNFEQIDENAATLGEKAHFPTHGCEACKNNPKITLNDIAEKERPCQEIYKFFYGKEGSRSGLASR
jgi:hypothetical protein